MTWIAHDYMFLHNVFKHFIRCDLPLAYIGLSPAHVMLTQKMQIPALSGYTEVDKQYDIWIHLVTSRREIVL